MPVEHIRTGLDGSRATPRRSVNDDVRPEPHRLKPSYPVESVDNALRLLQMLRDLGEIRSTQAAQDLNVSPSTVHRLMSMLVYRGFAVQDESRVYRPGPAMGIAPAGMDGARRLVDVARTHIDELRDRTGQAAGLSVLTGRFVRLLYTVGPQDTPGAEDRRGLIFPVYNSAGGRAILSCLPDPDVARLCTRADLDDALELPEEGLGLLLAKLRYVRMTGYAMTIGEAERGVATIAVPIRTPMTRPPAAIVLSTPVVSLPRIANGGAVQHLLATRDIIEHDLHDAVT